MTTTATDKHFKSYTQDREEYVDRNYHSFSKKVIANEVPEVSTPKPLEYFVHEKDLPNERPSVEYIGLMTTPIALFVVRQLKPNLEKKKS